MPTPNKPTPEELKEDENAAIKAAEELEKDPTLFQEKEDSDESKELQEAERKAKEEIEQPKEEKVEEKKEEADPSEEAKEKLKTKLSASARESQRLYAKDRLMTQAIAEAEDVPEPNEDELKVEYPEWEALNETEKRFAKETVINRKWREKISEARARGDKIQKWNDSVEDFIGDPKTLIDNPELEGKQKAFQEFADESENNSVPFSLLVPAFLYKQNSGKPDNKGAMFLDGSGGPNDKPTPKSNKITLEEAGKLMRTDYGKYKEYLRDGKIDLTV